MQPRRSQLTTALLMSAIAVIAMASAGLRTGSGLAATAAFTAAIVAAALAAVAALAVEPGRRAGWLGFAILSSGYLVLTFGPWFSTEVRPHLITTPLLDWLYFQIHGKAVPQRGVSYPMFFVIANSPSSEPVTMESTHHFFEARGGATWQNHERTGHSIASLMLGLVGARVATLLRHPRPDADHPSERA